MTLDTRQTNATYVTVQRKVKGSAITETVIPRFRLTGQPPLPENFYISLTGSTGMFYNNHAIGDFEACALDSEPIGEQVDHFEFDYSGSPLSCAPLAVTIKACKNAACSVLFDAPVIATLKNPNAGTATWLDSNMRPLPQSKLTINQGLERVYLQQFSSWKSTELEVAHSVPSAVPYSQTVCKQNGQIGSCQLRFAEAGFVISDVKTYANKPAEFMVKAVRKSDSSLQCVPTFGGQTKSLNFGVNYITKPFIQHGDTKTFDIWQGKNNPSKWYQWQEDMKPVSVTFDSYGKAKLTLKYPDAGKLIILANYRGSDKTHDAGLVMNSTNGNVYSVPFGFCVKPSDINAICKNNPALCDVYKHTGDEFPLAVSARAWSSHPYADICDNIVTPSFAMDNISLRHSLLAPTVRDGGFLGELGTTSINMQQGLNTNVNQTVSEVGVFNFSAKTESNQTYLDAGLPIKAGISQAIGRFVPSAFEVTDYSLTPACASNPDKPFSYMEQPFYTRFLVKALNQHSDVTRNYFAGFAKASAGWAADDYLVGHELGNRVDELPTLNWQRGIAEIASHTIFHRLQKPKPDGPYTEWELGVALNDNDGGYTKLIDTDMNSAHAGDCGTNGVTCTAKRLGVQQMLFGRVVMDNVYGAEADILRMPTTAQYWDGQNWQVNQLDSCTVIDNTHLLGHGEDLYSPAIVAGQSVTREGSPRLSHFQQGKFELLWQDQLNDALPADKQYYRGEITAPLAVPDYLKYYWQWLTDTPAENRNPRASADFGLYRGNDRIIYWKEVY
ncbi:DUF6701 domain-containing protein [Shewanella marina]|uniref:DUF6701 domain-containing protein n=1 Tax=Shewanella marina TaxID=487319 RepID=UPI00046E5D33|nr:DUF6701 domain-containing protein [Shewanella marina]